MHTGTSRQLYYQHEVMSTVCISMLRGKVSYVNLPSILADIKWYRPPKRNDGFWDGCTWWSWRMSKSVQCDLCQCKNPRAQDPPLQAGTPKHKLVFQAMKPSYTQEKKEPVIGGPNLRVAHMFGWAAGYFNPKVLREQRWHGCPACQGDKVVCRHIHFFGPGLEMRIPKINMMRRVNEKPVVLGTPNVRCRNPWFSLESDVMHITKYIARSKKYEEMQQHLLASK